MTIAWMILFLGFKKKKPKKAKTKNIQPSGANLANEVIGPD